jgi:hypothetical protein
MVTEGHEIHVDDLFVKTGPKQSELVQRIFEMVIKHDAKYVIVEAVAYQLALIDICRQYASDNNLFVSVIPHTHRESKKEHYRNFLQPFCNLNKLFVSDNAKELRNQLLGLSDLEDCVDALSFLSTLHISPMGLSLQRNEDYVNNDENSYTPEDIAWQKSRKLQAEQRRRERLYNGSEHYFIG